MEGLAFPKNMRWGSQSLRFARPIRWLVCLHGSEVIDVELAGVRAGRTSQGHRFLGGPVELPVADDYERALRELGALLQADGVPATIILMPELHEPKNFGPFAGFFAFFPAVVL